MTIHFVSHVEEVLGLALEAQGTPKARVPASKRVIRTAAARATGARRKARPMPRKVQTKVPSKAPTKKRRPSRTSSTR